MQGTSDSFPKSISVIVSRSKVNHKIELTLLEFIFEFTLEMSHKYIAEFSAFMWNFRLQKYIEYTYYAEMYKI